MFGYYLSVLLNDILKEYTQRIDISKELIYSTTLKKYRKRDDASTRLTQNLNTLIDLVITNRWNVNSNRL